MPSLHTCTKDMRLLLWCHIAASAWGCGGRRGKLMYGRPHSQTFPRYLQIQIFSTLWWRELLAEPSKEVGHYQTPALFEAAEEIFSAMIMFVMMSTNAGDQTTCFIWGCRARPGRRLRHWQPGQLHSVMIWWVAYLPYFLHLLCIFVPYIYLSPGTGLGPRPCLKLTLRPPYNQVLTLSVPLIIKSS